MQNFRQPINPSLVPSQRFGKKISDPGNRLSRKTRSQRQRINTDTSKLETIPTRSSTNARNGLIKAAFIVAAVALIVIFAAVIAVPTIISINIVHDSSTVVVSQMTALTTPANGTSTNATTPMVTTTMSSNGVSSSSASSTNSTSTTSISYACGNMTVLYGYDLGGSDLMSNTTTYTGCCTWCLSLSTCVGYTFVLAAGGFNATNACYLKNAIPTATSSSALCSAHY